MYFFGYNYKQAQEGIALSKDLFNWEKHPDPIITVGEEGEIDSLFTHKPSVISHEGVLYHFYCACRYIKEGDPSVNYGKEFRTISVAANKDISVVVVGVISDRCYFSYFLEITTNPTQ
jgi:hypothetical protein